MANGLKEPAKPKVHQALHGYVDGHRQIAISATLKPRDQKTLLALSDISGPGARLDEGGYLTGYPLSDSGFFALGRTWPAPEMPRPGCVWTHTILIDFNDLASLEEISSLLSLFKRPSGSISFQNYGAPTQIDIVSFSELSSVAEAWAKPVVAALYGKPKSPIVATRLGPEVDSAVLAIWSQQWPRLRRSFRFCTLAASDRSIEGTSFDLQLLPILDRSVRSQFSDVVNAESVRLNQTSWIGDALQDLAHPDQSGLRSFFRRLGSDVLGGREAFRPLCRLHRAIEAFPKGPEAVQEAITILQGELGAKQARAARGIVAKAALEIVEALDDMSFHFLWASVSLLEPDDLDAFAARLGQATWRRNPQKLVELLNSDSIEKVILDRMFLEMEIGELIEGLKATPQLLGAALTCRPELIREPSFWSSIEPVEAAFKTASMLGLQSVAVAAMFKSGRSELSIAALKAFGARVILQALSDTTKFKSNDLTVWANSAASDVEVVADFLANHSGISRQILYALAQALPSEMVPGGYGPDPWLVAWSNSTDSINESETIYLLAYFLSRAFGSSSRSQAELIKLSFESTHDAVASNRLPEASWRTLDPYLPWPILWFKWDRCQRLRAGVIDVFVESDLTPSCFAHLTEDDKLFYVLASGVARKVHGRSYLKRVLGAMREEGDITFDHRIRALEKLVD